MADKKGESKWWEQERKLPVTPYVEIDPKNRRLGIEGGISGVLKSAVPRGLGAVKRAARAVGEASAAGMAVATGGGIEDPRKPVPSKKVVQQQPQAVPAVAPQAPTIAAPIPSPSQQPAWGGLYNVTGNERQEGFANPYEAPSSGPGVAGGYFDEAKWAEAAKQLQSIIRGDNPRMQTVYRYAPGVGKYSVEEAMPQSEATKRAAMAHLFGMFPERLKADVGLREAETRGQYGLAEAEVRGQADEAYKNAALAIEREKMNRDEKHRRRLFEVELSRDEYTDPETLEKVKKTDVGLGKQRAGVLYEEARQPGLSLGKTMADFSRILAARGEGSREPLIGRLLESYTYERLMQSEKFKQDPKNVEIAKRLAKIK